MNKCTYRIIIENSNERNFKYDSALKPEDKRILNLLELKVCNISQNVELIGKQLTNNQIKDIFAN